jgi:hypothetical protein
MRFEISYRLTGRMKQYLILLNFSTMRMSHPKTLHSFWIVLEALYLIRFFRKLSTMPGGYNPDSFSFYAVKETIRTYNNFSEGKLRKFRQWPTRLWELSESGQDLFCLAPESYRC